MIPRRIKADGVAAYVMEHLVTNSHFEHEDIDCTCGIYVSRYLGCKHKHVLRKHYCGASIDIDSEESEDEDGSKASREQGTGFCFPEAGRFRYTIPARVLGSCKACVRSLTVTSLTRKLQSPVPVTFTRCGMEAVNYGHIEKPLPRQCYTVPQYSVSQHAFAQQALPMRQRAAPGKAVTTIDEDEASNPEKSPQSSPQNSSSLPSTPSPNFFAPEYLFETEDDLLI
jgi:hypothetical protein